MCRRAYALPTAPAALPPAQYMEVDAQQLAIKQRHEPKGAQEALEADYLQAAKGKPGKRPLGFEPRPRAASMALPPSEERKAKKRCGCRI